MTTSIRSGETGESAPDLDRGTANVVEEIRRRTAVRCAACGRRKAGELDALCPACWKIVPKAMRECYLLVWRLVHANLVAREAQSMLERMIAGWVREQLAPKATAAPAPRPASRISTPRAESVARLAAERLAPLPTSEGGAISATELAQRVGVDPVAMNVWLQQQRKKNHAGLRVVEMRNGKRVTYRYWRAA